MHFFPIGKLANTPPGEGFRILGESFDNMHQARKVAREVMALAPSGTYEGSDHYPDYQSTGVERFLAEAIDKLFKEAHPEAGL